MTPERALAHRLDRQLVIRARRETVFGYFTDPARWAAWWGPGSTIDARPGGRMLIRLPGGHEAAGEVVEVAAPDRIVFTYGMAHLPEMPPGSTRVTIQLAPHAQGTLLVLTHEFADAGNRDAHVQGWRFHLSLFVNLVAATETTHAADVVDRWFAAWNEPDAAARDAALASIAAPDLTFGDRYSSVTGLDELRAQLVAVHRFMPGMRLTRRGEVRHCQWHVLADWVATTADGIEKARGTNLFELDADGHVAAVTGFWAS